MRATSKLLWSLFFLFVILLIIKSAISLFGIDIEKSSPVFKLFFLGTPVAFVGIHAIITLGFWRALFFILLASTIGTFFEHIGLRDGVFFGGHYTYPPQITLFTVPVSVILFWAVFIYIGYSFTNSFLHWFKVKKRVHSNSKIVPLLILLDVYFVVAVDFFLDPIAVKSGSWTWIEGGPYFGIPWGNFIGWVIVATLVSSLFRTYEYFAPHKNTKYDKSIMIIPVLAYGIIGISYIFSATKLGLYGLPLIGSLFMLPQVIVNIIAFARSYTNQRIYKK